MIWIIISSILSIYLIALKVVPLTFITTFGAALAGAWGAYMLQVYKENKKIEKQNISSINKACFILLRQINAMEMFKRDLDKVRELPEIVRAFEIPAWKPNSYNDLKFNFEELSFLLDPDMVDSKDLNLLHDLFIVQECFEQAIETINQRSIYFINKVTPEMEEKGIDEKPLTIEEIKNKMDINKISGLVFGTNNMYEHVDKTYSEIEVMEEKFVSFAKSLYPNQKFITLEKNK